MNPQVGLYLSNFNQDFWPRINVIQRFYIFNFLQRMSVHQKLGIILESKVVQKLSLEKNVFTKQWSPKLIFLNDFFFKNFLSIFDIENWPWKYNFGTFWWAIIHCGIVLKEFPLSLLILGQKSCILGATIFKIPQLNSALYKRRFQMGIYPNVDHRLLRPLGPFAI